MSSSGGLQGNIKNFILVLSGKGGVGKSSVSVQLAVSLALQGKRVGLLDVDLCGPSIPRMINLVDAKIKQGDKGWIPVTVEDNGYKIKVMSIGFLLPNQDDSVVWRGPKKDAMIKQFIFSVEWGELDYLVIDTPPGTSNEHLSLIDCIPLSASKALLVTTPQLIAISDVERNFSFCYQLHLPILGVVENLSGYSCPHCKECTNIFSSKGGMLLAERYGERFLGNIPITPKFSELLENNETILLRDYPRQVPELYEFFKNLAIDMLKEEVKAETETETEMEMDFKK